MLPRKSVIETIDCLRDEIDSLTFGELKILLQKVSKLANDFMPLRLLADLTFKIRFQ